MRKCKILVPIGCRSDAGISKPIIKRLKENDMFEVQILNIKKPGHFISNINDWNYIPHWSWKPDLVFITGDRIEQTAIAYQAFHNHIPIAHYLAGVLNYPISTLDDINRHCISLWSDIQLVESYKCLIVVENLFAVLGRDPPSVHVVGSTYLDDIEIDESLVPKDEYDLVLINPTTLIKDKKDLIKQERKYIVIGKNPDPDIFSKMIRCPTYDNLPRAQYLGLLKNCTRFITNSSSEYYEAPYFLKPEQIIHIGIRNKDRTSKYEDLYKTECASDNIVEVLKEWWLEKNEKI